MKHSELIEIITKQRGKEPTQQEIAEILGLTRNAISSRAFRDKEYSYSEVEKIENFYNVNFSNQAFIDDMNDYSGEIIVDYYPEVFGSCGNGIFELSQIKEKIKIPKLCISDYFPLSKYSIINAYGDSMNPNIQNGDKLVIEHCGNDMIRDNQVYVFCYNEQIYVKRLIKNINEFIIKSDNPDKEVYKTQKIQTDEMNKVYIIGRVVGLIRNFK